MDVYGQQMRSAAVWKELILEKISTRGLPTTAPPPTRLDASVQVSLRLTSATPMAPS